ncbi:MAG TPA: MlaD family protein [Thermoanaerobaculia bacterium]|nr:MlaD family protein [Thermoanaerobaculia bacterium]
MSEYDDNDRRRGTGSDRRGEAEPEASVRVAKWGPWIWIVPALAIFFAGYLVVRYGFFGGGDVTVRFSEAHGLDRYSPVRFRGAKVGTVQKITIDEDGQSVLVRISMDASMNYALRKGTRFWIVEPGLEGGGLGGLLSGTYVGIAPGEGDETREFTGQEYAPVLSASEPGKTVILEAHGLGAVSVGSPMQYQGMRVGRVLGSEYDEKRGVTLVHAFVVRRFADSVRQSTRFYRGGGLNLSVGGGGVSVAGASLGTLLTPPISFYTPEILAGAPAAPNTHFTLFESEAAAIASADGPHVTYLTYFPGPISGLKPGTPVTMKGVQVGRVRDVRLRYVDATASLETPVMLEVDPRLLEIDLDAMSSRAEVRARMDGVVARLVNKGMRANLATSLVLPGASAVTLDFMAQPGTGRLVTSSDPPIIPAAAAGRGLDDTLAAINDVANTVRGLPLREIASNLRSTSARLNRLVSDPALEQSLQRLNRSLAEVERITKITGENVGPIVESLRNAADSAEAAAKSAQGLLGTQQKQNYDVAELIRELTRAAEAVRALASYLTENPDALLKGRPK